MDRRKFITTGLAGLAAGSSLGLAAKARGQKLVETEKDLENAAAPGQPEIPGGKFHPQPGKTLDGGPGYNHPRNILDGAARKGVGPHKDISPVYTYKNIPSEDEVDFKEFKIFIDIGKHEFVKGSRYRALGCDPRPHPAA